jgi:hypothetical protein
MLDHLKEFLHSPKHKTDYQLQVPVSSIGNGQGGTPNHGDTANQPDLSSHKELSPHLIHTTQECIDVFLASSRPNGQISGLGYWQTANGYTAIALHDFYSSTDRNMQLLHRRVETVALHHPDLINEFNDDTLWWGHCLLDIYQVDPRPEYIKMAARLHAHVSKSVIPKGAYLIRGMDMGGAVLWTTCEGEDQVNAITTGLYAELSARLALHLDSPPRHKYLRAAEFSLDWVFRCRYNADEALVLDTIKLTTEEFVDWTFTYTTGQAISACVALFETLNTDVGQQCNGLKTANHYLHLAREMAKNSMHRSNWVEEDGTLTEHGAYGKENHEPWQNDDAVGFKSVLVRALAKLYRVLGRQSKLKSEIGRFVETQFDSLQERDRNDNGQYGPWWNGPMEMPTSHSQMAVLDVMAAVHLVRRGGDADC